MPILRLANKSTIAQHRQPGEAITEIRRALVNHECGSKKNVRVKLHYDDYRRVTLENRDYFYAPLPLTPFGIAVVLPQYGRYYIKVSDANLFCCSSVHRFDSTHFWIDAVIYLTGKQEDRKVQERQRFGILHR